MGRAFDGHMGAPEVVERAFQAIWAEAAWFRACSLTHMGGSAAGEGG